MVCRLTVGMFIAASCLAGYGCTYRAWHAGLQQGQRQECYKITSQEAVRDCLAKVDSMNYDQYQEARKEAGKNNK